MNELRKKLGAMIQALNNDLSGYLRANHYERVDEKEYNARDMKSPVGYKLLKDKTYVRVSNNGERNNALTAERIVNVLEVQAKLNILQTKLDGITEATECVQAIQDLLHKAIEENNRLGTSQLKVHSSYRDNRLAGMGIFSSWWHKTWFQSRATVAFESALNRLDQFKEQNNLIEEKFKPV